VNNKTRQTALAILGPVLTNRGFAIRKDPTKFALVADKREDDVVFSVHVHERDGKLYANLTACFCAEHGSRPIGGDHNIPISRLKETIDLDMAGLRDCAKRNGPVLAEMAKDELLAALRSLAYVIRPTVRGWLATCNVEEAVTLTVAYDGETPLDVSLAVEKGGLRTNGMAVAVRVPTYAALLRIPSFRAFACDQLLRMEYEWRRKAQDERWIVAQEE